MEEGSLHERGRRKWSKDFGGKISRKEVTLKIQA